MKWEAVWLISFASSNVNIFVFKCLRIFIAFLFFLSMSARRKSVSVCAVEKEKVTLDFFILFP
jgi:hypothetical protein